MQWCGHVLGSNGDYVLERALDFEWLAEEGMVTGDDVEEVGG